VWLEKSGLILKSCPVKTAKQSLNVYRGNNIFKRLVLDVGLLGAMADLDPTEMVQGELIFR
jgi:hypothetical protein